MPVLTRDNETNEFEPGKWTFWRNLAVYFCVLSVVGHWLEILYCSFMDLFGIVAEDFLVWDDPMYPFLIYGIGATVCVLALVPLKEALIKRNKSLLVAAVEFFVITVFVCMFMELAMGFILNQPNELGIYPLWDNSELPLNIFGQAWLVNDLVLGAVAMLYTWILYPLCEKLVAKIPYRIMNVVSVCVVVGFVILCLVKFA